MLRSSFIEEYSQHCPPIVHGEGTKGEGTRAPYLRLTPAPAIDGVRAVKGMVHWPPLSTIDSLEWERLVASALAN